MKEWIWEQIANMHTPGFFITADIATEGVKSPNGLEAFIKEKITQIHRGNMARKFVFREGEWRIYLTFFPTDGVVDERYALKNKMIKLKIR